MGMFVHSSGGGGRRARRRPMSEINVTPMVDVMLVLLVIFMVTAPLLTTGVEVDLPEANTPTLRDQDNKAIMIAVQGDGRVFIGDGTEADLGTLGPKLKAILATRDDNPRIYVRGDTEINYGRVMEVLGVLYESGFTNAALITKRPS